MKKEKDVKLIKLALLLIICTATFSCVNKDVPENQSFVVESPDGTLAVGFQLKHGIPFYNLKKEEVVLINDSRLGFKFKEIESFDKDFRIAEITTSIFDSGKEEHKEKTSGKRRIDEYSSLFIKLKEGSGEGRKMNIEFRVYNDGMRFCYEIPEQATINELRIIDELTEFSVAKNFDLWWVSSYEGQQSMEFPFKKNKVSQLSEAVQVPLVMQYGDNLFLLIHEAIGESSEGISLLNNGNNTLKCTITGNNQGVDMKTKRTPWRTIQVVEKPNDLLVSVLYPKTHTLDRQKPLLRLLEGG